ncbi:hypothetical protein L7F22_023801, partial [Adiantum nelumboides]|nr:hypothetical protein [Adiantum nelumboides]
MHAQSAITKAMVRPSHSEPFNKILQALLPCAICSAGQEGTASGRKPLIPALPPRSVPSSASST